LTADEFTIMKTHAELGSNAIAQAEADAEKPVEFLAIAKEIAHYHHEKWDGSGYPCGLSGDNIPISARLMALADVFDALICVRVYKPAMPFEQARDIILQGSGAHFDPDIVAAFVSEGETFLRIAKAYAE
jgi:putative two-component system response regulator